MKDENKTKAQLITELQEMRQRVSELERQIIKEKNSENALQESEDKFKYVFENIPIGISLTLPAGEVQANKTFYKLLGYPDDRDVLKWHDFTHHEDIELSQQVVDSILSGEKDSARIIKRYLHKDGTVVWVEVSTTIRRDSEGRTQYFMTAINDITGYIHTEEQLRESERKIKTLMSNLPGMAYRCKNIRDWTMSYVSDGCFDLTGYEPEELVNDEINAYGELIHPEDTEKVWDIIQEAIKKGKHFELEYRIITKNKEVRWVWERGVNVENDNDGIETLEGFISDITDRKRAEEEIRKLNEELEQRVDKRTTQLETANKELKEFAYAVSHDLKAPLRAVSQLATWIHKDHEEILDKTGKEYLNLMVKRVKRMDSLIDGILKYSRIGRIENDHEKIVLTKLLDEIIESLDPPQSVTIKVEKTLPIIYGSRIRITQLFQNLIHNAIKYMDKPLGLIQIKCKEKYNKWQFSIADNGPGINKKYFKRIFTLFQTLQARDEIEATGIGLTLVKKIIENAGGEIWIESEIGKGTTFYFTWPQYKK